MQLEAQRHHGMEKEQRGWEVGVRWEDQASLSAALSSHVTLASGSSSVK